MDVVRDFVRGAVTVHVLYHAAEAAVTGSWMAEELARHGYKISPGTLYPLLHRLEASGLLVSRTRVSGGRTHREYGITTSGHEALDRLRNALSELAEEVLTEHEGPPGTERAD